MKPILSIFFNTDRTYLTLVEPKAGGLELVGINSTKYAIDLENPNDDLSKLGKNELYEILNEYNQSYSKIVCSIPATSVAISQVPGQGDMDSNKIAQLVGLEIRQTYPQFNYDDFASSVIPLEVRMDGKQMLLATIIPKKIYQAIKETLKPLKQPIDQIEISQINAHLAFLYNYPDERDKTVAFFNIQDQFVDVSCLLNGKPIYYNLNTYNKDKDIANICEAELTKLMSDYVAYVENAYFIGTGLTKDNLAVAQEILLGLVMSSGRLNPFRMMSTKLSDREKQYCARVQHIFAPCIGACIQPNYEHIKLY